MRYSILVLALLCSSVASAQAPVPDAAVVAAPTQAAVAAPPEAVAPAEAVTLADAATLATDVTTTVPTTDEGAGEVLGQLLDAAKNGHWAVAGGLCLLLLIWVFRRLGLDKKIGPKWVPWVTMATGVVLAVAVGLIQGWPVHGAAALGAIEGLVAIGLWEAVFKHFKAPPTT